MDDVSLPDSICGAAFAPLTAQEIRAISVKEVTNPSLFDQGSIPSKGGLYDPIFGPASDRDGRCETCCMSSFDCAGHFGHVELPVPVFHPLFMLQAFALLRGSCRYCHQFLCTKPTLIAFIAKLRLLECGLVDASQSIDALAGQAWARRSNKEDMQVDGEAETGAAGFDAIQESAEDLKTRLLDWVELCIKRAKSHRDNYKFNIAFEIRKRVISEFLKGIAKRKCPHCGAVAHRMRKEGYTKVLEYSLTPKQQAAQAALQLKRHEVDTLDAMWRRQLAPTQVHTHRHSDDHSDSGYDDREFDSDDGDEPGRKRVATPPSDSGASSEEEPSSEEDLPEAENTALFDEDAGVLEDADPAKKEPKGGRQTERLLSPGECRAYLRQLFHREREICDLIYGLHGQPDNRTASHADRFFVTVVSVPPSRFRPASEMGGQIYENEQNTLLSTLVTASGQVRQMTNSIRLALIEKDDETAIVKLDAKAIQARMPEATLRLQAAVNGFIDSSKNPNAPKGTASGVKQLLEKKEGLFRMNMMGKRVNYSARSVISPDVNIETNEIGVPPVFAAKLTFPEPVTRYNIPYLQRLIINGPFQHPGAVYVERDDGTVVSLVRLQASSLAMQKLNGLQDKLDEEGRAAVASQLLTVTPVSDNPAVRPDAGIGKSRLLQRAKRVYRHLDDGDILILNRQPTLHKPSMMCHRARILKGEKTIRMHYANCNSYNADFDGDEMNIHFPQSLVAQAEAKLIANTDNQYLVPTSGNPLRGLIQDHVVAGVWFTSKNTFFSRSEYQQVLNLCLRPESGFHEDGVIKTLPPAILRPAARWTGKQVISTILMNIKPHNTGGLWVRSKSKVPGDRWGKGNELEDEVRFVQGEFLTGILDKSQFGASKFGLVHAVYEVYGADTAGKLLSIFSRLFTNFLQDNAFSCRLDDLLLTPQGNEIREGLLAQAEERGRKAATGLVGLQSDAEEETLNDRLEDVLRDDSKMALLDVAVKSEVSPLTSDVIKKCLPDHLYKAFPHNNMQTMTVSGAKGSNVNASQISCLLGQQELEGRRVPTMVSGKTLPSFKGFETAPRAGGYVAQRFLTGVLPQEFFFHCMAGREGLIDTAVKTSRSGYLQRCLIKHLEGIRVHYDHTVRNNDGTVIQFAYGEDAIDVTKAVYLDDFDFAIGNSKSLIQRYRPGNIMGKLDERSAPSYSDTILRTLRKQQKGEGLDINLPDPTLTVFAPSRYLGSVSERFAEKVDFYVRHSKSRMLRPTAKKLAKWPEHARQSSLYDPADFVSLMHFRYLKALADPGEAVGLLASQGVGEPSTQMTLNTFHFAGHGAANVTLGIPRLREIVMTAAVEIKTPTMKLPFLEEVVDNAKSTFCKHTSRLILSELVDAITVKEKLALDPVRQKVYTIKLDLFPRHEYAMEYATTPEEVLNGVSLNFADMLDKEIIKEFKSLKKQSAEAKSEVGKAHAPRKDGGAQTAAPEGDEDEAGAPAASGNMLDLEAVDDDADDARRAAQTTQGGTYDDEDEDEGISLARHGIDTLDDFEKEFGESDTEADGAQEVYDPDETDQMRETRKAMTERMEDLETRATAKSRYVESLTFDKQDGQWIEIQLHFPITLPKLMLTGIVERACRVTIVRQYERISRALLTPPTPQDPETYCTTEGSNLHGSWQWGAMHLDLDRLYTNDIAAMLNTYGVEAARATIISEMSGVFGAYGIGVDRRHLTLIADYMTCEGGYKPFNRMGLSTASSPMLKASFETTAQFVSDAALHGDFEDMSSSPSPSASIVVGLPPAIGSGPGVFGVLAPRLVEAARRAKRGYEDKAEKGEPLMADVEMKEPVKLELEEVDEQRP